MNKRGICNEDMIPIVVFVMMVSMCVLFVINGDFARTIAVTIGGLSGLGLVGIWAYEKLHEGDLRCQKK